MVRVPTHRPPTHPGEMLLEEFLEPLEMTVDKAQRVLEALKIRVRLEVEEPILTAA